MRGIVLQPVTQAAKEALAQQLACWAKTASGLTDLGVRYGTCCASPSGETIGRWIIPPGLCSVYGELPFTSRGQAIPCDPAATQLRPYYIYETDVAGIDPDTCSPDGAAPLPTPTGLAATPTSDTSISVDWNPVANATGYSLTVWPSAEPEQAHTIALAAPPTELTGLDPQTAYTIEVVAVDQSGTYLPSAPAQTTATTPGPEQLAAPTGLAAEAATVDSVDLSWTASPQADGYTVSWALAADPDTPVGTDTTTGTSYAITGLAAGTEYIVSVVATDSTGTFTDSAAAVLPVTTAAPEPLTTPGLQEVAVADAETNAISLTLAYGGGPQPQGASFTVEPGGHTATVTYPEASATFTGLDQDVVYTYTAVAVGDGQSTGDSAPLTGSFTYGGPQQAPASVTATATGPVSVNVDWDLVAGVDQYRAQIEIGAAGGPIASGLAPVTPPHQFDGLDSGTVYVAAVISLGQPTSSSTAGPVLTSDADPAYSSAVTTPLAAPANVTAGELTAEGATITWDAVAGAATYTVSWALAVDPDTPVGTDTATGTSYAITGLAAETDYLASVVAAAPGVPDSAPGTVAFTTTAVPQLDAPTGLAATDLTADGATLTWNAVDDADGYTVSWALATDPDTPVGTDTATGTSYAITGLAAETDYLASVVATDSTGTFTDSAAATSPFTTAALPVLPSPTGLEAGTPTTTGTTVTWTAVSGADGYTISWALAADPSTLIDTASVTGTSHAITGLEPGTDYVASVVATDSTGGAVDSAAATVPFTTAVPPELAAPTLDNVTMTDPGNGQVTITVAVEADPNGTQYTLNPGGQSTTVPSGTASATFGGVEAATTYTYTAVAVGDGTTNLDSPALTGTFTYVGELPDPANVTADPVLETSATISWDAVAGAVSYTLDVVGEVGEAGDMTIEGAVSPQEASPLLADTGYTASVVAVGSLSSSSTAGPVLGTDSLGETTAQFTTAAPQQEEALAAPTGLSVSDITAGGGMLSWDAVAGAEEYTLSWALASAPEIEVGSFTTTETSYGLLGLLAGTLYVVTVRAHASGRVGSVGASIQLETSLVL